MPLNLNLLRLINPIQVFGVEVLDQLMINPDLQNPIISKEKFFYVCNSSL